ncbi:Beta-lactamase [Planctomycetes bacterium MalM25]|nr:Beta-lactamase [Planctomycetes bacterium MalM25]
MNRLLLIPLAPLVAAASSVCADLPEQIDALCQPYVESQTVGGMSVGIIKGGQAFVRGYGQLSADDSTEPDGETIYEIGSVSKVFTGLLLAEAVIDSRVSLVTPADELLPKGVTMNRRHESLPIRLWHLSTHTSGLPRLPSNLDTSDPDPYANYGGRELAAFLKEFQPRKRPGEQQAYSNLGAGLLGSLLAREQKTGYDDLLQKRVVEPLGMKDTRVKLAGDQRDRVAPPHTGGGLAAREWGFDQLAGAGGIHSTANDLLSFAQAQLDPPEGDLGQAIDLAWMIHQQPIDEDDFAMGLGWHVARDGSTRWHNGQTSGYHAALFISRRFDAAAIVLTNTATGEVDALAGQIIRLLAGQKEKPREFEKTLEIDPELMRGYAGVYRFAPGVDLTVTTQGGRLMAQLTGQPAVRVYPRSETEWFYKVVEATLTFQADGKGRGTAVELFQNGIRQTAKRVD